MLARAALNMYWCAGVLVLGIMFVFRDAGPRLDSGKCAHRISCRRWDDDEEGKARFEKEGGRRRDVILATGVDSSYMV